MLRLMQRKASFGKVAPRVACLLLSLACATEWASLPLERLGQQVGRDKPFSGSFRQPTAIAQNALKQAHLRLFTLLHLILAMLLSCSTSTSAITPAVTPMPIDTPTLNSTALPKLTDTAISSSTGHTVSGHVAEFPPCFGTMRGMIVVLEPTGRTTMTDLSAALFSFEHVSDGNYTLVVSPPCNPFGCWPETPVAVAGADVDVQICPVAKAAPTPASTLKSK